MTYSCRCRRIEMCPSHLFSLPLPCYHRLHDLRVCRWLLPMCYLIYNRVSVSSFIIVSVISVSVVDCCLRVRIFIAFDWSVVRLFVCLCGVGSFECVCVFVSWFVSYALVVFFSSMTLSSRSPSFLLSFIIDFFLLFLYSFCSHLEIGWFHFVI